MNARRFPGFAVAAVFTLAVGLGPASGAETETVSPARVPQVPSRLTLDAAVALALDFSPDLADASWQVSAAEGREIQAGKAPNTQLDFRFSRLGERGGVEDVQRRRLFLRQPIELGGKRRRRVDLAQIDGRLADWSHRSRQAEITTEVAVRFAEVQGAQRSVELYDELVVYIEKLHAAAGRMVETGSLRRMELQLIVQRLGLARIDLRRAEADLAANRFELAATWGSSAPAFDAVVGDLETAGPLPSIDVVLEMAKNSPVNDLWETQLARSEAELSLARSGAVPDLEVGLGVAWQEETDRNDYFLDFEIDLPFFDRNQGDIRAARSEVSRTQARRDAAQATLARRVANLYYRLSETEAQSSILGSEVIPAARTTVEGFRLGFEGQADGLVDLLDSRRDLAETEVDRAQTLVDYRQTLAELEYLVGEHLVPTD